MKIARILVIEDNPANLDLIVYLLQAFGYATCTALDGEAGVAAARRERPDLILCDIQLPKLDGFGVIRELKATPECAQTPAIAVTAYAMAGDKERICREGFDGCVTKPIDPERFVEEIELYLTRPGRTQAPRTDPEPEIPAAIGQKSPRATILVVDDLPANLLFARSLLEPFGYQIVTASGGRDALTAARRSPPDLIISDVCMHHGSGYDFIRDLKTSPRLARIPFIFVTATLVGDQHREAALSLGANRFLVRPVDAETLLKEVQDCLGSRTPAVKTSYSHPA